MKKNKGSEWRKWDLHIHTPASFYWKGTKKFKSMTSEEKEAEMKTFIQKINETDVDVFCLMDYWTFDWYLELVDYLQQNPDELKKTIFPGMELRVESPTDYRLNIHVILSNMLSKQELIDFKGELYIRAIDKKLSDDSIMKFAKTLDESKARIHGYDNPESLNDELLFELGSKTIEITKDSLKKAFDQIPVNSGYILLPYDTSDGLLNLNWEKHPHADNYFMQSAHIFESRDQVNVDLINGIKTDSNKKFFDNFLKTLGNRPKPCVSGSDAHKYNDYGKYPSERITWIKADTTFEGFKQILYEPKSRVKIQSTRPEFKEDKLVIEEVKFISSNNKFNPNPIYLNENLNVIIGGKSSGKSILLYNIANTLLADRNFLRKEGLEDRYKFKKEDQDFNFEIKTKGGFSQLMYREDSENSVIPEVKYIPQNYLVKLAEPEENKKGAALNNIIRDLIKEDQEAQECYDNFLAKIRSNDKKIEGLIDNYFEIKDRVTNLENQLKTKSNKDILEKNIETNSVNVQELNKRAGMSPIQIEEYNKLQIRLEEIKVLRVNINSDFTKISGFSNDFMETLRGIKNKEKLLVSSLENQEFKSIFSIISNNIDGIFEAINSFNEKFQIVKNEEGGNVFKMTSEVSTIFLENNEKRKEIEALIAPYLKNEETKKQIDLINKSISEDKASLQAIGHLQKEIEDCKRNIAELKDQIFKNYEENYKEYEEIIIQLKIRTIDLEKDGLKIDGLIKFNFSKFRKTILDFSDGRKASFRAFEILSDERNSLDDFILKDLLDNLRSIFEAIIEKDSYSLIARVDRKNAIKQLLKDYFFDYWQIKYRNDKLGEMSTGKASFVILMLIVGLSKSKAPILIDQPEDNLDNRSITTDLVEYLRNKKIERQIILVTHNPNIVVNADSENIIIANQKGQNEIETSSTYQFDYINGSLENSFSKISDEKDLLKCMGIREHIADIVEGGQEAFKKREEKYGFK